MKRALILAYHYPPAGGGGVQRTVKFVRHLPDFGYEPVVLTGPAATEAGWTPLDPSLSSEAGSGVTVQRAAGPMPQLLAGQRAERLLFVPTPFSRWWTRATVEAARAVGDIDVVFSTMSPWQSAGAAERIASERRIPWIADLRDPWALDEMMDYPSALHRQLEQVRMGRALASAASIVMNTNEAASALLGRFPSLRANDVRVITNGFDADDFAGPPPAAAPGFRIVHTGSMHTAFAAGREDHGRLRRWLGGRTISDPSTRSHQVLMRGLGQLKRDDPALASTIEVHLAGALSDADRAVDGHGLIRERGYLPHAESVELVRSADLLFLPLHDLPEGRRATIVPGKAYEYLGSGRPILAAVPAGDALEIMTSIPWAHAVAPSDASGMAAVVAQLVRTKQAEGRAPDGDAGQVARFERRALAGRLAEAFDAVLERLG